MAFEADCGVSTVLEDMWVASTAGYLAPRVLLVVHASRVHPAFRIPNSEFSVLLFFLVPRRLHLLPDVSQHACDQIEGDDPEHDVEEYGWHPRIVAFRFWTQTGGRRGAHQSAVWESNSVLAGFQCNAPSLVCGVRFEGDHLLVIERQCLPLERVHDAPVDHVAKGDHTP